jgi:hypothetical protein
MSHGGGGAPIMGGAGGRVLQCRRGRERVRRTPLVSHDARRTGLPRSVAALMAARWCGRRGKRGQGVQGSTLHGGGKWGRRSGARAQRGIAQVADIGPRPVGAGGGVAVRQGRATGHEQCGREWLTGRTGRRWGLVAVMGCGRE